MLKSADFLALITSDAALVLVVDDLVVSPLLVRHTVGKNHIKHLSGSNKRSLVLDEFGSHAKDDVYFVKSYNLYHS